MTPGSLITAVCALFMAAIALLAIGLYIMRQSTINDLQSDKEILTKALNMWTNLEFYEPTSPQLRFVRDALIDEGVFEETRRLKQLAHVEESKAVKP